MFTLFYIENLVFRWTYCLSGCHIGLKINAFCKLSNLEPCKLLLCHLFLIKSPPPLIPCNVHCLLLCFSPFSCLIQKSTFFSWRNIQAHKILFTIKVQMYSTCNLKPSVSVCDNVTDLFLNLITLFSAKLK